MIHAFRSISLKLFISTFLAMVVFSCASTNSNTVRNPDRDPVATMPVVDESFDPVTLEDEDLDFPENNTRLDEESNTSLPGETTGNNTTASPAQNRQINGYRVQLFATRDNEIGELEKKKAEFLFAEDEVAVYIEYDSPMYKIRVGDCQSREDAEALRDIARRKDYVSAWVVPTKVNSNPILPMMQDVNSGGGNANDFQ